MVEWILVLSVVFAGLNNIILRYLANTKLKYNPFLFNSIMMLVWILILLCMGGIKGANGTTVLYAFLYGLITCGFIFFKNAALTNGPISITSLIGGSSFIFTTIFNSIYFKDDVKIIQIIGMVVMVIAVLLVNFPQKTGEKTTLKWKILCAIFFVFAGLVGIIFRFHQIDDKAHTNEMMIMASAFATIMLLIMYGVSKLIQKAKNSKTELVTEEEKPTAKSVWAIIAFAVASGIVSCVYNRCNIFLSGAMPTILFSPIFNGALILVSFVAGLVLFKEKATVVKIVGFSLGIVAIICFSGIFGLVNF
ncbi:MAG: EamA family transporter [Clostridia bacterium]|nr:EamA family transporter [Clostridia bacterium]